MADLAIDFGCINADNIEQVRANIAITIIVSLAIRFSLYNDSFICRLTVLQ